MLLILQLAQTIKKYYILFLYLGKYFSCFIKIYKSALLGVLNMMLPMQKINEWLFKIKDDEPLNISYDIAELDFDTVKFNNSLFVYSFQGL